MKNKNFRQGDLIFLLRDKNVGKRTNVKTIAYGEVTGHHHSFGNSDLVVSFIEGDEVKTVEVLEVSTLRHQEHKPIEVETGTYWVFRKTEYDPFEKVLRQVRD